MPFNQLHVGRDEPILEPDLPIVDSHFHLWDRPALRYMFEDYLADIRAGHRIVASVFVETQAFARKDGPEMLRPLGEVEFANGVGAMADSGVYGDCRVCAGIVGHADLRHGAKIGEYLDRAMAIAPERFRGVRQITIDDPDEAPYRYLTLRPARGLTRHPEFRSAFAEIGKRGLTFDAAMFHHQLGDALELADAFPDTTIVIGHAGHLQAMGLDAQVREGIFERSARRWSSWRGAPTCSSRSAASDCRSGDSAWRTARTPSGTWSWRSCGGLMSRPASKSSARSAA